MISHNTIATSMTVRKLLYERSVVLIPNNTGVESANTNVIGGHSPVVRD